MGTADEARWMQLLGRMPAAQRDALYGLAASAVGIAFRASDAIDHDCEADDSRAASNRRRFVEHIAKLQARLDTLVGEVSRLRAERLAGSVA